MKLFVVLATIILGSYADYAGPTLVSTRIEAVHVPFDTYGPPVLPTLPSLPTVQASQITLPTFSFKPEEQRIKLSQIPPAPEAFPLPAPILPIAEAKPAEIITPIIADSPAPALIVEPVITVAEGKPADVYGPPAVPIETIPERVYVAPPVAPALPELPIVIKPAEEIIEKKPADVYGPPIVQSEVLPLIQEPVVYDRPNRPIPEQLYVLSPVAPTISQPPVKPIVLPSPLSGHYNPSVPQQFLVTPYPAPAPSFGAPEQVYVTSPYPQFSSVVKPIVTEPVLSAPFKHPNSNEILVAPYPSEPSYAQAAPVSYYGTPIVSSAERVFVASPTAPVLPELPPVIKPIITETILSAPYLPTVVEQIVDAPYPAAVESVPTVSEKEYVAPPPAPALPELPPVFEPITVTTEEPLIETPATTEQIINAPYPAAVPEKIIIDAPYPAAVPEQIIVDAPYPAAVPENIIIDAPYPAAVPENIIIDAPYPAAVPENVIIDAPYPAALPFASHYGDPVLSLLRF